MCECSVCVPVCVSVCLCVCVRLCLCARVCLLRAHVCAFASMRPLVCQIFSVSETFNKSKFPFNYGELMHVIAACASIVRARGRHNSHTLRLSFNCTHAYTYTHTRRRTYARAHTGTSVQARAPSDCCLALHSRGVVHCDAPGRSSCSRSASLDTRVGVRHTGVHTGEARSSFSARQAAPT